MGEMRVAVLGASGYIGGELLRLLAGHPSFEVTFLGAKDSAGSSLAEVQPHLGELPLAAAELRPIEADAVAAASDLAFSALPHGTSFATIPSLLDAGVRVVDLSGDFRLEADVYPAWYGYDPSGAAPPRRSRLRALGAVRRTRGGFGARGQPWLLPDTRGARAARRSSRRA